MLQAGGRLADVIARPAHRQRALAADHLGQVGAGDEFHHQEMPLAGGFRVVDRHHVGMIEAGGGAGLAHEAIHGRGIGQQLGVDHLQRHGPLQDAMLGAVDRAHPPGTQQPQHAIAGMIDQEGRRRRQAGAGLAKDQVDQQGVGGEPLQVGLDGRLLAPPQPILQLQRQQLAEQGALLQCGGGHTGQAFLQRRRRAGLPGLLEPPAHQVDPLQALQGKGGIAPRIGRQGCFRDHDLPLFFKSRWPAPRPAGSTPAAARRCAGRSPAAGQSRRWCSRRVSTGRFAAGAGSNCSSNTAQFSATMAANSGVGSRLSRPGNRRPPPARSAAGKPPPRFCRRSYLIRSCALWAVSTTSRGQRLSRSASCGKRPPAAPKQRLLKAGQRHVLFIGEAAGAGAKLVPRQADQAGEVGLPELPGSRRLTPL